MISGYYGGGNFGDELLLDSFQKIFDEEGCINLTIVSHNINYSKKMRKGCVCIQSPLYNKRFLKTGFWYYAKYMKKIDTLIIGGGQIVRDKISWTFLGSQLFLSAIAKFYGKKVIMVGIGADKLYFPISRVLLKLIFPLFDTIITRDRKSALLLEKYHNDDIVIGNDLSLTYLRETKKDVSKHVVINLREYNFDKEKISILSDFLDSSFADNDVILLATEKDDVILSYLLKKLKRNTFKSLTLKRPDTIKETINILSNAKIIISMRFHYLVSGAMLEKNIFALSYDVKVKNFCEAFGIPYINTQEISVENLQIKTKNLFDCKRGVLKKRREDLLKVEKDNCRIVHEVLYQKKVKKSFIRVNLFFFLYSFTLIYYMFGKMISAAMRRIQKIFN